MKSRYLYKGFTIPEVLVGLVLTALAAAAVIVGSYHYYRTINNVRLKDYAFERLKNYTELYSWFTIPAAFASVFFIFLSRGIFHKLF